MTRKEAVASLCVALDVPDAPAALKLVNELKEHVGMFKIGLELFTSTGPDFVKKLTDNGAQIFLDLKFHDIPNTVAGAARSAARLGVAIFNVHASGGPVMLRAALQAAHEKAQPPAIRPPKVIAVTVLTSIDQQTLKLLSQTDESVSSYVVRLARMTKDAGLDGVIASPQEIKLIRAECGPNFLIITPGIRPAGTQHGDQKRVMTPRDAIQAGASAIVVGRPITGAKDPRSSADGIIDEMIAA